MRVHACGVFVGEKEIEKKDEIETTVGVVQDPLLLKGFLDYCDDPKVFPSTKR